MEKILNINTTRKAPYLPNFKSSPARIIDPLVLASTWALGSQKCRPITGIFTRNGINNSSPNQLVVETLPLKKEKETKGDIIIIMTRKGILNLPV